MSDNLMSRRRFLVGAGTVAAAAGLAGVGLAKVADPADAAPAPLLAWPYPTAAADQPNPEAMARRAFEVYMGQAGAGRGCAEATWWPFVEFLAATNATTWATLPANIFRFGAGGVAGWGTICGTLNAAASMINMVVANGTHRTTLTNGIFQYYAETALPTNGAWKSYQKALGLSTDWAVTTLPLENVPSSTANSPLCHSSLVQWTMTTGAANGGPLQKDRCGKACFDVARKLAEMLNEYFVALTATPTHSPAAVPLDPAVAACGACHATYTGAKMACGSCHDNTLLDGHMD
jgi:hypothetical protein